MTRKNILLIAIVVLLAGLSFYLNRGRFQSDTLKIGHRSIEQRTRRGRNPVPVATRTVVFLFDREVQLTSVKVLLVSELETNKYAHPVWDLVSDSNSVPVKTFPYGANVRGMRPAVKGAVADPLLPGAQYRLLIEAGSFKATHDFTLAPRAP